MIKFKDKAKLVIQTDLIIKVIYKMAKNMDMVYTNHNFKNMKANGRIIRNKVKEGIKLSLQIKFYREYFKIISFKGKDL